VGTVSDLADFLRARLDEDQQHLGHMLRLCPDPPNHIPSRRLVADDTAKRKVLRLYENALSARRHGSMSLRNQTQDEAAVDVLGAAIQALAEVYDQHPGYREEWRLL
jgi:hypothetical protein